MNQPHLKAPGKFSTYHCWVRVGLLLMSFLFLAGCGKNDLHVCVEDAGGLRSGSPVIWRGAEVGTVTSLGGQDGMIRVSFEIEASFRPEMHEGTTARIASGLSSGFRPSLRLYGGTDHSRPQLAPDAEIPINTALFPDLDGTASNWLKEHAARLLNSDP